MCILIAAVVWIALIQINSCRDWSASKAKALAILQNTRNRLKVAEDADAKVVASHPGRVPSPLLEELRAKVVLDESDVLCIDDEEPFVAPYFYDTSDRISLEQEIRKWEMAHPGKIPR